MPDFSAIDAQVARIRALGALPQKCAPDIAEELQLELENTIRAGADPYGQPWQPTLKGDKPLQNAARAVHVAVIDRRILFRVTGVEARHHRGWARGGVARAVIPTGELPITWEAAIRTVLRRAFEAAS